MKKAVITGLALVTFSTFATAKGVIGNNVSVGFGFPKYPDVEVDYSTFAADVSGDFFITENLYLHGELSAETFEVESGGLTYYLDTKGFGGGIGGEYPLRDDEDDKMALYLEGAYYFKEDVVGVTNGVDSLEDPAFDYNTYTAEAGLRTNKEKIISELGVTYTGYSIDGFDVDPVWALGGSFGLKMGEKFILRFDGSMDIEPRIYYFGMGLMWAL